MVVYNSDETKESSALEVNGLLGSKSGFQAMPFIRPNDDQKAKNKTNYKCRADTLCNRVAVVFFLVVLSTVLSAAFAYWITTTSITPIHALREADLTSEFTTASPKGLPLLATGGPSANVLGLPMGPGFKMDPNFVGGSGQIKNMTVHEGQTAYMDCRVQNLGAKKVSWIRRPPDVRLLAVGEKTFTTDERFSSKYQDDTGRNTGRFTLAIKRVGKSDEGTYVCQISTKPIKSFVVHLKVNVGSGGWFVSDPNDNCDEVCQKNGHVCTVEGLETHNDEVDSSTEMMELLNNLGVYFDQTVTCGSFYGYALDTPSFDATTKHVCWFSGSKTAFSCSAAPSPAGGDKQRLCYCKTGILH